MKTAKHLAWAAMSGLAWFLVGFSLVMALRWAVS